MRYNVVDNLYCSTLRLSRCGSANDQYVSNTYCSTYTDCQIYSILGLILKQFASIFITTCSTKFE